MTFLPYLKWVTILVFSLLCLLLSILMWFSVSYISICKVKWDISFYGCRRLMRRFTKAVFSINTLNSESYTKSEALSIYKVGQNFFDSIFSYLVSGTSLRNWSKRRPSLTCTWHHADVGQSTRTSNFGIKISTPFWEILRLKRLVHGEMYWKRIQMLRVQRPKWLRN